MKGTENQKIKHLSKAYGLKSTFLLDDNSVFMTSFGKGNAAQPEKIIVSGEVENLKVPETFTAENPQHSLIPIVGGRVKEPENKQRSLIPVPKADQNALHAKKEVEQLVFGKNFPDNIHVQQAYNILDMWKIFDVYANQIVYTVDNIYRGYSDKEENGLFGREDDLGMFSTYPEISSAKMAYELRKSGFVKPNQMDKLGFYDKTGKSRPDYFYNAADNYKKALKLKDTAFYFRDAFMGSDGKWDIERSYTMLRILCELRQCSFHGNINTSAPQSMRDARWFFRLDSTPQEGSIRQYLDRLLEEKLDKLNNNFLETNKVNLSLLRELYPEENLENEYYDFIVRKEDKNLGFSLKKLREAMLERGDAAVLKDKKYDSVRPKLYGLFDFVLYHIFIKDSKKGEEIVEKLRQARTEEEKEKIYRDKADTFWKFGVRSTVLDTIAPRLMEIIEKNGRGPRKISKEEEAAWRKNLRVQKARDLSYFSKAMYAVCLFLDGKEINQFLCALINKLENIASFTEVLRDRGMETDFLRGYEFFGDAARFAKDLRFIKSIARMSKSQKAVKEAETKMCERQYADAAALLGETDWETVKKTLHLGEGKDKRLHTFRNFLINNVINSNRFNYVCRYTNPKYAGAIMKNKVLVEAILKEIPQKQLERYCLTIGKTSPMDVDAMAKCLSGELANVRFATFKDVPTDRADAVKRERYKALVGLYLTVLYLIVKTLVKINTSYTIAFAILERDKVILEKKPGFVKNNYSCITDYFQEQGWLNERVMKSFEKHGENAENGENEQNAENGEDGEIGNLYDEQVVRYYRNCVVHLSVPLNFSRYVGQIRTVKSMFDVYHYVLFQRIVQFVELDKVESDKNKKNTGEDREEKKYPDNVVKDLEKIKRKVEEYNTVSKNFLCAINRPFAYNAARYINLSVRKHFLNGYGK